MIRQVPIIDEKRIFNFRDVGERINGLMGQNYLPLGQLFRCGRLDNALSADEVGQPRTIINLRTWHDLPEHQAWAAYHHFPLSNTYQTYHTCLPHVHRWLNCVVQTVAGSEQPFPLLVHCTAGKDRTGVVVATLLAIAGVPNEVIEQEYLLSDGRVSLPQIQSALLELGDLTYYFRHIDLNHLRLRLLGQTG